MTGSRQLRMFRIERHHRSCPHRGAGRAGIGHGRRLADEPSFNPAMTGVELLTPLPIGLGTRFRARMGRAGRKMVVELTGFDRPHRLGRQPDNAHLRGADLCR
jgi:hypothetical protein